MAGNVSEELARLAALRDQGVLTVEEFETQKAAVLRGDHPATTEAAAAPGPGKKRLGKGCLIVVAILVILSIIGAIVGKDERQTATPAPADSPSAETRSAVQPTKVTAKDLFDAYQANEAAAQQRYGSAPLLVSGTVDGVDLDMMNNPVVKLRTSNEFMSAMANLTDSSKPKASGLRKGQTISVLCKTVGEVVGIPQLQECDIQ